MSKCNTSCDNKILWPCEDDCCCAKGREKDKKAVMEAIGERDPRNPKFPMLIDRREPKVTCKGSCDGCCG